MSTMRQLPQHPGQTPTPTSDEGERSFAYPPHPSQPPPPFERHRSYPIQYLTHPPPQHERAYYQHHQQQQPPHSGPYDAEEDRRKKRARGESITSQVSPRRQSTSKVARQESMSSETRPTAPSVLVREKKQVSPVPSQIANCALMRARKHAVIAEEQS